MCSHQSQDNWQECGSYGPANYTYHNGTQGTPLVNHARFPDMKVGADERPITNMPVTPHRPPTPFQAMTDYAHSLNLTAGWYGEPREARGVGWGLVRTIGCSCAPRRQQLHLPRPLRDRRVLRGGRRGDARVRLR